MGAGGAGTPLAPELQDLSPWASPSMLQGEVPACFWTGSQHRRPPHPQGPESPSQWLLDLPSSFLALAVPLKDEGRKTRAGAGPALLKTVRAPDQSHRCIRPHPTSFLINFLMVLLGEACAGEGKGRYPGPGPSGDSYRGLAGGKGTQKNEDKSQQGCLAKSGNRGLG